MIADFGFGYERILWAINGGKNFYAPFVSKYDYLFGDLQEVDRIKTITLMVMSGIKPSSSGKGKHIRSLMKDIKNIEEVTNIDDQITEYYNFYGQFIEPTIELENVRKIIKEEVDFNIKKKLLSRIHISSYSSLINKSIEEICQKVFLEDLRKQNDLTKNKEEKKVRKL